MSIQPRLFSNPHAPFDGHARGGALGAMVMASLLLAIACTPTEEGEDAGSTADAGALADAGSLEDAGQVVDALEGMNPNDFDDDGLAAPITEVDCTLSNGEASTCYRVVVGGVPTDHDVGPFCPTNISDGPEVAGIWVESGTVYDVDGSFIEGLADFYNDANWQLYDPVTGAVNVTEGLAECEAAARPDVDPALQNHCVECSLEDFSEPFEVEYLIPKTPVARTGEPGNSGAASAVAVSFTGTHYDPPAPVANILAAYTIAAFDDCGGHVNPATGYHYHAATGCPKEIAQADGHAPVIGVVLDGYALHAMVGDDGVEADDLDDCRGHSDDVRGYHYHAASAGENMFIGCLHGEISGDDITQGGGPDEPGETATDCAEGQTAMCCGDGVCDGPETAETCAADCS